MDRCAGPLINHTHFTVKCMLFWLLIMCFAFSCELAVNQAEDTWAFLSFGLL